MFFCNYKHIFIMIEPNIPEALLEIIRKQLNINPEIFSIEEKGGGSINAAAIIRTDMGAFFAKWNSLEGRKGMFAEEAFGLNTLAETGSIRVPKVIGSNEDSERCYLIMEHVDSGDFGIDFWEDFGTRLARLHKNSHEKFGFNRDNFIGSLPQQNNQCDTWAEFFAQYRIEPQLKRAVDSGKADTALVHKFENLFAKLNEIFPNEKPALLHGDLWGGNFMCSLHGEPVIFDPAVYYGNREMDIAMTRLFGGFDTEFYDAYHAEFPLVAGYEKRFDICNLYPLLVHVNLFPGSYIQSVKHIVNRF